MCIVQLDPAQARSLQKGDRTYFGNWEILAVVPRSARTTPAGAVDVLLVSRPGDIAARLPRDISVGMCLARHPDGRLEPFDSSYGLFPDVCDRFHGRLDQVTGQTVLEMTQERLVGLISGYYAEHTLCSFNERSFLQMLADGDSRGIARQLNALTDLQGHVSHIFDRAAFGPSSAHEYAFYSSAAEGITVLHVATLQGAICAASELYRRMSL
jgi:hypothetical protein